MTLTELIGTPQELCCYSPDPSFFLAEGGVWARDYTGPVDVS